ncbi:MAG: rod shape-determining protein MreD [Paracoccaceae bacterium]
MANGWISSVWMHRLLFLAVAGLLIFLRLLPLQTEAGYLPGPNLLLCLIFAWTVRRPEYLPVLMIAGVVLLEDMLLMRPPGLWTGLVILASEFIRSRVALTRELNFGVEWLLVAGLMVAMFVAYRIIQVLAMLPQPAFGFALVQILWSVIAYPAVVAVSRYGLDLHKPAMGELDAYGRPL